MTDEELKLACLLASYDMDSPHVGFGPEEKQHYPNITPEKFLLWLGETHCGDCTSLPAPCIRCFAEEVAHQAQWIAKRM